MQAERLFALDYKGNHYLDVSFEKLQWWSDLEDRVIPVASILEATLDLLNTLDEIDVRMQPAQSSLPAMRNAATRRFQTRFFKSRQGIVKALMTSATGLKKRMHGALSLVSLEYPPLVPV